MGLVLDSSVDMALVVHIRLQMLSRRKFTQTATATATATTITTTSPAPPP